LDLIEKAIRLKQQVVEADEKEAAGRLVLNFGHTIGHSLEKLENFRLGHGTAIALGQIMESRLSMQLGFLKKTDFFEIFSVFKKSHFPLVFSQGISPALLKEAFLFDKKASRGPRFILLKEIGKAVPHSLSIEIPEAVLKETLVWGSRRFASKTDLPIYETTQTKGQPTLHL